MISELVVLISVDINTIELLYQTTFWTVVQTKMHSHAINAGVCNKT